MNMEETNKFNEVLDEWAKYCDEDIKKLNLPLDLKNISEKPYNSGYKQGVLQGLCLSMAYMALAEKHYKNRHETEKK